MQIPMEILSHMTTRTDSSPGGWHKTGPLATEGAGFGSVLESAVEESRSKPIKNNRSEAKNANTEAAPEREAAPEEKAQIEREPAECRNEPDECANADEAVAGVMWDQKEVVFIFEGDKESATTPEIRVEAEPETGKPKQEEPIPEKPETKLAENNPEKQPELKQPAAEANEPVTFEQVKAAAEQNKTVGTYAAQNAETEAAQQATKQETTANAEVSSGENPGEVTARTPSIRTSEQQGNEQNKFGAPQHGDLSPLENENDTSKVKGQKEATYSETAEAVRDNAEKTLDSTSSAPPLAGGIKPEQYVASQQMKQIAQDAPVKSENLFDEMVLRLESMKTDSQSSMTIHLKPAYLGRVALELVMDAAGLHVKISAEDSGVRTMINGQITALMESLSNKGIEVAAVEVAYTGVDNGAFKENREDGSRQDNKRRYRREINRAESVNSYTVRQFDASDYYLETGVSSVQYSA